MSEIAYVIESEDGLKFICKGYGVTTDSVDALKFRHLQSASDRCHDLQNFDFIKWHVSEFVFSATRIKIHES